MEIGELKNISKLKEFIQFESSFIDALQQNQFEVNQMWSCWSYTSYCIVRPKGKENFIVTQGLQYVFVCVFYLAISGAIID